MDFEVVILGANTNAYYMARCHHEAYNQKAHLIAKEPMRFTKYSDILTIEYNSKLWENDVFVETINNYAENSKNEKILIIPSSDFYVRLLIENQRRIHKKYVFHAITEELLNNLLVKENFYTKFKDSDLDFPKTMIFDCSKDKNVLKKDIKDFLLPIIVKPSDGVEFYKHEFSGQAKVYKLNSFEQVENTIKDIVNSGYKGKMIIQEFIPGGDDKLFDSIFYCDQKHKVKLVSFAQIGLQEHTRAGVGNCTVLINGYNEFGDCTEQVEKMTRFLEDNDYCGFAEFDLKYDIRDHKYKVLEINPRQARSSYYLCACGFNLVKYLVDDLIFNKKIKYHFIDEKMALTFVPMAVINRYVDNKKFKKEIKLLKKQNKLVDPLDYTQDKGLKRKIWILLKKLNYLRIYKKSEW